MPPVWEAFVSDGRADVLQRRQSADDTLLQTMTPKRASVRARYPHGRVLGCWNMQQAAHGFDEFEQQNLSDLVKAREQTHGNGLNLVYFASKATSSEPPLQAQGH